MEKPFRKHDAAAAVRATSMANHIAENAQKQVDGYRLDSEIAERSRVKRCRSCFYFRRSRIGGAAMTRWFCGVCGSPQSASSTATDTVCRTCSDAYNLCTQCGGDLEGRERRRKWPEPASAPLPNGEAAA